MNIIMKRIRQGNTINFRYSVYRSIGELKEPEDLTGVTITATLQNRLYGTQVDVPFSTEVNVIATQIPGIPFLRTGIYNFCLSYQKDGWDFTIDADAFQIVDSSAKTGGADTCRELETEIVELSGTLEFGKAGEGGIEQVQSDWGETDPKSRSFIRRKPILSTVATSGSYNDLKDKPEISDQSKIPTKTSELENDSGFISDLNYVHTDNNYSDEEKEKVAGLQNYDDAALRTALQSEINRATEAEGGLDAAVKKVASDLSNFITGSPDADDIINRWQEVTAFLNGITEDKTLSDMLLDLKKQIDESVTAKLSDYYTSVRVDELFVKKLVGSRLITEEEVLKLAGLQNYDDTTLKASLQEEINRATEAESSLDAAIKKVASDFAAFLSGDPDADDLINRWQEVTAFLQGITEEKTLSGMLLGVKQEINESVTAKLADYYTSSRIDELFVKKLVGSRLITEEEATKLSRLQNYDDTAVRDLIAGKANAIEVKNVSDPNGANAVYAIEPNVFYDFDLVGEIHLSLTPPTDRNVYNEYMFQFIAAENNIPFAVDGVRWITEPEITSGKTYQVSIVNNLAVIGGA